MGRARGVAEVSAIERLRALPVVFRGADLTLRFGWTSAKASQYLYLWKQRGLVEALGGHSDVYANGLVATQVDWPQALRLAMPSAVTIGVEALRLAGWTTQIPARPEVAVLATQRVFHTDRFEIVRRGVRWFRALEVPGALLGERGRDLRLSPAWALADLFRTHRWGGFGLWPDDVDWHRATARDAQDWANACQAFGVDPDALKAGLHRDLASTSPPPRAG